MNTWRRQRTRLCVEELESRTGFGTISQFAILPILLESAAPMAHAAAPVVDANCPVEALFSGAINVVVGLDSFGNAIRNDG